MEHPDWKDYPHAMVLNPTPNTSKRSWTVEEKIAVIMAIGCLVALALTL